MRAAAIHFLSYAAWFSSAMLIPNFAQQLGASEAMIGFIVAGYGVASLISSYIFGRLADIHGRRLFLHIGLAISAITCVLQIFPQSPEMLFAIRVVVGFAAGIFPAALLAYAYESKWRMGKFMSYGSLGWGLGTIVSGILATYFSVTAPFLLSALLFAFGFAISVKMPRVQKVKLKVPMFPVKVIKKNMAVYLAFLVRHMGACSIWVIFPIFVVDELGGDYFWIGVIYSLNTFTQFAVMRVLRKRSTKLIIWGLILSVISFWLFTMCENIWQLLPIQVILATSWAYLYVGSIKFIMARNAERATATGILNSVTNMSSIGGALIGGAIAGVFGYRSTMYLAALMSLAALVIFLVIRKVQKNRLKKRNLARASLS